MQLSGTISHISHLVDKYFLLNLIKFTIIKLNQELENMTIVKKYEVHLKRRRSRKICKEKDANIDKSKNHKTTGEREREKPSLTADL